MIQTINVYGFRDEFHRAGRGEQFSYEGLGEIYEYLEECDPDMELDVIAICCDFAQCSLDEFLDSYGVDADIDDQSTDEEKAEAITEYIGRNGGWYALVENDQEVVFSNF